MYFTSLGGFTTVHYQSSDFPERSLIEAAVEMFGVDFPENYYGTSLSPLLAELFVLNLRKGNLNLLYIQSDNFDTTDEHKIPYIFAALKKRFGFTELFEELGEPKNEVTSLAHLHEVKVEEIYYNAILLRDDPRITLSLLKQSVTGSSYFKGELPNSEDLLSYKELSDRLQGMFPTWSVIDAFKKAGFPYSKLKQADWFKAFFDRRPTPEESINFFRKLLELADEGELHSFDSLPLEWKNEILGIGETK